MSGFPSLQPAMTFQVAIDPPTSIGITTKGSTLNIVPMIGGTLKTEPNFSPAIDGEFQGVGNDYINVDPSGKHMRLNAHGVIKDKTSSGLVYLNYTGIVDVTPALGLVLSGDANAKTTDFGNSFIEMRFETGHESLKELETTVFVGAGRFLVEKGKPIVVEYKLSKVVK